MTTGALSRPRTVAGVAYLLLANLFRTGLGVITSAVIFRVLGPDDAGRMAAILGAIGLLSVIGEFGMRNAAIHFIAQDLRTGSPEAYTTGRTFLLSKTFLSTVATGVTVSAAGLIASSLTGGAQTESLIRLAAFSLLADGLLGYSLVILEAHRNFAAISLLNGFQSAARFALVLVLFVASQVNLVSLLLLESVVPLAAFVYSLRMVPAGYLALRRPDPHLLGQFFRFSKWIAVAALSSLLIVRLDVILLSISQPPAVAGVYAAALAVVNKIDLVKVPIMTASFPDACRRVGRTDLKAYVRQSLGLTVAVSLACLPLFLLGNPIIGLLYGQAYVSPVPAFGVLIAAYLIGLNVEPVAFVLFPLNKPIWVAGKEFIPLVLFLATGALLIPKFGLMGAAWCVLLRRVIEAALTLVLVWRHVWRAETRAARDKGAVTCI
ncbi:MAG: oligosaccharide flippase family protein [Chloroflexi bacterium]|nr:oligosaccharide flippase family protein [Chloroflexota bacterium]